jgi:hypothetical protein
MYSGRVLGVLLLLATVAVTQAGSTPVDGILLPLLVALIAIQIDREGGRIAIGILTAAAVLIPRRRRQEELDDWLDHVQTAGQHGLLPLTGALSIAFIAAPALAVGLRVGRRRQAARGARVQRWEANLYGSQGDGQLRGPGASSLT